MKYLIPSVILCQVVTCVVLSPAAEPRAIKHQITGLFSLERVPDLREVFQTLPEFKLISIDYQTAEASIEYDPLAVFPGATAEQIVERFDSKLRGASRHTFGIKPLCVNREKLELIEIPVAGLDCKGCCLAAYESIYRIEGVEQATASFKIGRVTAWIDPATTNQATLEAALRKKEVQLETSAP